MADNVTNELLLEHLKAMRGEFVRIIERLDRIEHRLDALSTNVSALVQRDLTRESELAAMDARIARIEKRLELSNGGEG